MKATMKKKPEIIATFTERDRLKAERRASREEEIALHGKPLGKRRMVHRSRKAYDRKRMNAVSALQED